jgi:hypothetical protein
LVTLPAVYSPDPVGNLPRWPSGEVKSHSIFGAVAMSLVVAACSLSGGAEANGGLRPFQVEVERPDGEPLFELGADGVRLELFDLGDCALIIEEIPGYGFLVDEFCPIAFPAPVTSSFDIPTCPFTDFGDEWADRLPVFAAGRTLNRLRLSV